MNESRRMLMAGVIAVGTALAVAVPTFAAAGGERPSLLGVVVPAGADNPSVSIAGSSSLPTTAVTVTVTSTPATAQTTTEVSVPGTTQGTTQTTTDVSVPGATLTTTNGSTPTSVDDHGGRRNGSDDDRTSTSIEGRTSTTIDDHGGRRDGSERNDDRTSTTIEDRTSTTTGGAVTTEETSVDVPGVVRLDVRRSGSTLTLLAVTPTAGWSVAEQEVRGDRIAIELRSGDGREAEVRVDADGGRLQVRSDIDG
jgi:hypothetical protein